MKTIGVVGAGVMGAGVAQSAAQAGLRVLLMDVDDAALATASRRIHDGLRMRALLGQDCDEDATAVMARITPTASLAGFADVDFVVENVVEKWEVKRDVYAQLDHVCRPACVIAANTSVIPITQIAAATGRPSLVLGMHFMNPVPLKPAVEVIRGFHTSDETLARAQEFLQRMGKRGIVVNDAPGFVNNRILMLMINEAVNLVQEGVATAQDIDDIFESCDGHKMGPLATADLIGLDTILLSLEGLQQAFGDPRFRPSTLLRKLVSAGRHGRKSGSGFFEYDNHQPRISPHL
jgi:3-hydroxybutyryl-CoA dehydrogenase